MLTLTKSLFALMLGFIISTIFGVVLIPLLKKIKAGQRINVYVDAHRKKSGDSYYGRLYIYNTMSYNCNVTFNY